MIKKNPVTIIAVVFVIIALVATVLGLSFQTPHDHAHEVVSSSQADDAVQEYTCSMHPNFRSTDPNERCPICGMELIPVTTTSTRDDDGTRIEFSGRSLALLDLQTHVVERGTATAQLRMIGSLDFDERALTSISAWTGGRIERLHVNFTGAYVEAGEPLVELYSPELFVAQQELMQAHRQAQRQAPEFMTDSNQTTLRATRERLRLLGLTGAQIDAVIEHGEASDNITIHAPSTGLVVSRNVSQGDYVNTGDTLLELANENELWAVFELFERDLQYIEVGQQLEFYMQSSNQRVQGRVESLAPRIDAESRTREVRVALHSGVDSLTAGTFVRALVDIDVQDVLTIPASAPLITGNRAVVYIRIAPERGEFDARTVELGRRLGDSYEVLSGLEEGDIVVSRGAFRIDSELQLRGQPSMMSPQGGEPEHQEPTVVTGELLELHQLPATYFGMWDALHSDNLAEWQAAAERFYTAADEVSWPDTMHHLHAELSTGAGHAHHVANLEQARELFQAHSQAMIALARAGYLEVNAYLMFCPMAFNNQGAYWLQPNNQLLNPYFGSSMLRCGDQVETFEASHAHHGGH